MHRDLDLVGAGFAALSFHEPQVVQDARFGDLDLERLRLSCWGVLTR
jgi:hypothetical protein